MNQSSTKIQPKSIDRVGDGIQITWQDDYICTYSANYLRESCPCAVCKETPGHAKPKPIPQSLVSIKSAHPMGWYAIQFVFSDGHDTGIYPYEYLRKICPRDTKDNP